jgi:hypothetical protein
MTIPQRGVAMHPSSLHEQQTSAWFTPGLVQLLRCAIVYVCNSLADSSLHGLYPYFADGVGSSDNADQHRTAKPDHPAWLATTGGEPATKEQEEQQSHHGQA